MSIPGFHIFSQLALKRNGIFNLPEGGDFYGQLH